MQGCLAFSTTTSSTGNDGQENSNKDGGEKIKRGGSILDLKHATDHCKNNVKKFDYYAFRVAAHLPTKI